MKDILDKIEDARSLAQVIVETVREPLLVLDADANILFASGSFQRRFLLDSESTRDCQLFSLDGGAWDLPILRQLIGQVASGQSIIEGLEIVHKFPRVGSRILLLHARKMTTESNAPSTILLAFEDITERRAIEHEKESLQKQTDELVLQKQMLLEEMQHRIVNSLQIIASILMLKARAVNSEETRAHLQDAHRRVMSVAAVQQHLHSSGRADLIEIAPYLTKLCGSLAESMIGESRPAVLDVVADSGIVASGDAISIGLIVTELVINALKYAFPKQTDTARVTVRYEVSGRDWKLSVSDNGIGRSDISDPPRIVSAVKRGGLGTSLVNALAHQLDARVEITSSSGGMSVSITRATFTSRFPAAA